MKEIWINLELDFESYEFSNFWGFFLIFQNLFSIFKVLKTIQKGQKVVYSRVGPTWMRRGTQGHVAQPRRPTRALAWRGGDTCVHIYIYS